MSLLQKVQANPLFKVAKPRKPKHATKRSQASKASLKGLERAASKAAFNTGNDKCSNDSKIAEFLHSKSKFFEETQQYSQTKMNEKMIVNYLQCLINSQSLHLTQFIRKKLVEAYVRIEVKHKFENQAMYYLLSMYDHDVDAVIARQRKKTARQRAQRWREEKELREYLSPRTKRVHL